jgi:FAD/FMN-containing dehydrogenase
VPRFIELASAAVRDIVPAVEIVIVAHLGDGTVHFIPLLDFATWQALPERDSTAATVKRCVNDVAHELGGTFSAEHGIGRALVGEMAAYKSAVELDLMRSIKRALDPSNLFNPGRLLPADAASASR